MSKQTRTDPVLGVLKRRRGTTEWVGRVRFTPKHEIEVIFDQFHDDASDIPEQLVIAGELYELMRQREWDFRLAAAAELVADVDHWKEHEPPEPEVLARGMRLVGVVLFGDRSGHLTYHGPPPFEGYDIEAGIGPSGDFDDVDLFTRQD